MTTNKRLPWLIAGAIMVVALALVLSNQPGKPPPEAREAETQPAELQSKPGPTPLPDAENAPGYSGPSGNVFLKDYGLGSPKEDMQKVGHAIEGMLNIFKQIDNREIATNEQLSAYITGGNPEGLVYLDPNQQAFNNDGRLVDRWNSPLIVHPVATGIIELRSHGPDKEPYTDDDIIRLGDGQVLTQKEIKEQPYDTRPYSY